MSLTPTYTDECFELFNSKLHEFTIRPKARDGWKPKNFVQTGKLRTWLTNPNEKSQDPFASILLDAAYREWDQPRAPINYAHVTTGPSACLLTLCILLELRQAHLLHYFRHCDIVDSQLPMKRNDLQDRIESALIYNSIAQAEAKTKAPDFAKDFDEKQWKYFAVRFVHEESKDYKTPHRILPFIDRNLITDKGATAEVYEVAVPQQFVDENLQKALPSPFVHPSFQELGQTVYHFAVKVFKDGDMRLWQQETSAYRNLDKNKGMVKYLGDFNHVVDGKATHNILLEYAENDLAEYFYRSPPVLTDHIGQFWKKLLGVLTAIEGLHNFEVLNPRSAKSTRYKGWHADIKPENILLVRGEFKLADPGFARFQKLQDDTKSRHGRMEVHGGTSTYSAPERFSQTIENVDHTKSDMWSLGCVFSQAATWVVLGNTAIKQYAHLRKTALDKLVESGKYLDKSLANRLKGGDCFHDGEQVIPEVTQWHDFLRAMLRPTDMFTREILDMIDMRLFQANPKQRWDAKDVLTWLEKQGIPSETSPVTVSKAVECMLEATAEAEAGELSVRFQELGARNADERKAAKSSNSFLQVPGSHRSTLSLSASRNLSDETQIHHQSLSDLTPQPSVTNPYPSTDMISGTITRQSTQRGDSISENVTPYSSHGSNGERHTVFDAHYHHMSESGKYHGMLKWLSKAERKRKDDKLQKGIVNRDLVFLVDNGQSMQEYWSEAMFLLEILVNKTWNIDPDGLELAFTNGGVHVKGNRKKKRDLEEFKSAMINPEARPTSSRTDMSVKLSEMLSHWLDAYKLAKHNGSQAKSKMLTIIVLTDGKWEGMSSKPFEVDSTVVKFNERLQKLTDGFGPKRPVSIQFISFGHDPDAIYRLRRLDNNLGYDGVPDIIDTEPSDGDIYQMLLGSISDDRDNYNDPTPPPGEKSPPSEFASPVVSSPTMPAASNATQRHWSHARTSSGGSESKPPLEFSIMKTLHE